VSRRHVGDACGVLREIRPLKLVWKFFVKKQGYREGWRGLVFSFLFAFTHFLLWAKYWEGAQSIQQAQEGRHVTG
jgi:hypothetical protein